jgi:2,3-dihydroxyphenylpropionate 1,2-dioxygenase|nr:hypothetical protein [Pseudomonas rhodesiae]
MSAYMHGMSHTPLVCFVDTTPEVLVEVDTMIAETYERIARFDPELIPPLQRLFLRRDAGFCIGMIVEAIGDFDSAAGALNVPKALAEPCAQSVVDAGVDAAVSYRMEVDGINTPGSTVQRPTRVCGDRTSILHGHRRSAQMER